MVAENGSDALNVGHFLSNPFDTINCITSNQPQSAYSSIPNHMICRCSNKPLYLSPTSCFFSYLFPLRSSSVHTRSTIMPEKSKTKTCDSPCCLCCHLTVHPYALASLQYCSDPMKSLWATAKSVYVSPDDKTSWAQQQCEEAEPHHRFLTGLIYHSSYGCHFSLYENNFMQRREIAKRLGLRSIKCKSSHRQLMQTACYGSTLQVVLPQFGVSDVGDVVERSAHGGLVLTLAAGCGLQHHSGLRLSLPGPLSELWRLRDARGELRTQPERNRRKKRDKIQISLPLCYVVVTSAQGLSQYVTNTN